MTLLAQPAARTHVDFAHFLKSQEFLRLASSLPGRAALLIASAVLLYFLRTILPQWPIVVGCAAAMSSSDRRRATRIAIVGMILATAITPNWYRDDAATHVSGLAPEAGVSPIFNWVATIVTLLGCAGFLALVRAGRPKWLARHPFLSLLAPLLALIFIAALVPMSANLQIWAWSIASALSGYIWVVALIAGEQRNAASQTPFLEQFIVLHPVWGSTGVPYLVAPRKLRRLTAADGDTLLECQLRGLRLLAWASVMMIATLVYYRLTQKCFGVPTPRDAVIAYAAHGLPWSMRWLSLISEFFGAVLKLATFGHTIVGSARLLGYDLPRNTYKPFASRTIAEFSGRYYYYFKELMLNLFYFPAFLSCFRGYPRLRSAFATFMAAGVGNWLFHFLRELSAISEFGLTSAISGMGTYAVYCLALSAGITISQLRRKKPLASGHLWLTHVQPFLGVMLFFCLIKVFDDTSRTIPLSDHLHFFFSLFWPFGDL